jgi:enamine deaminase RidA (YjgF/YER057c/UK114 family)
MERIEIHVPGVDEAYNATLLGSVPEYGLGTGKGLGHAVVTSGGRTLRMSGYPSISEEGVIGKGDMGLQTTIALDHVRKTVEMAGGTFNDIIHFTFFVTDHKQCWEKHLPTRIAYFTALHHHHRSLLPVSSRHDDRDRGNRRSGLAGREVSPPSVLIIAFRFSETFGEGEAGLDLLEGGNRTLPDPATKSLSRERGQSRR